MNSRTLKWLHRVGYFCTALVVAELIAITSLLGWAWLQDRTRTAGFMRETSTHEGALADRPFGHLGIFLHLPANSTFAGDGLRFAGMQQLGIVWYALSVGGRGDPVPATLVVDHRGSPENRRFEVIRFTVPKSAYGQFERNFDRLTEGYPGYVDGCLDGVAVAFERVRASRITSGNGNAACNEHYRELSAAVVRLVDLYSGLSNPPLGSGWYPARPMAGATE